MQGSGHDAVSRHIDAAGYWAGRVWFIDNPAGCWISSSVCTSCSITGGLNRDKLDNAQPRRF